MDIEGQKKLALTISVFNCPNCGGRFYPKSDTGNFTNIRCGDCYYEVWFHLIEGRGREVAFSVDTEDMERIMMQKIILPPVILYWKWQDEETKIRWEVADLYPFIPYTYLRAADISIPLGGQINNTTVFLQDELLPTMRLYTSPSDEELAEEVSNWSSVSTSYIQRKFNFGYARSARIGDMAKKIRRQRGITDDPEVVEDDDGEEE